MKSKKFIILDSETVGLADRAFIYDVAYIIATRKRIILERNFIIREIITSPKKMLGAFYNEDWREHFAGKIFSHYIPRLADGTLKIYSWRDFTAQMREDMHTHDVQVFTAYNLAFDTGALSKTQQAICDGGKILDSGPTLLDLWLFACVAVCDTNLYHDIAWSQGKERGWITPSNNVRTTAEKVYAFLSGDLNFIEAHTAIADARIETEILQRLLARKQTIPYGIIEHMPWRRAQKKRGTLFGRANIRRNLRIVK